MSLPPLSRREAQVMDVLFRRGEATAADVLAALEDPPTYSSVRSVLAILERKGLARHREDGPRYVYAPAVPPGRARRAALRKLVRTFFGGSPERAMAALLDMSAGSLSQDELDRLATMINDAKREGR